MLASLPRLQNHEVDANQRLPHWLVKRKLLQGSSAATSEQYHHFVNFNSQEHYINGKQML